MRSDATLPCGCPARAVVSRTVGNYVIRRSMYRPGCTLGVHSHAEDRIVLTLHVTGRAATRFRMPMPAFRRSAGVSPRNWM
jgi:hypothetical protein